MAEKRDIYTCGFCSIGSHPKVECGGIYYCPNPLCTGPGAAWARALCTSYKEEPNGRHSVDWAEWRRVAKGFLDELDNPADEQVWAAFRVQEAIILEDERKDRVESNARRLEVIQEP